MDFSCNSIYVVYVLNLVFFKDFHGDAFVRQFVDPELHFAERTLSDRLVFEA